MPTIDTAIEAPPQLPTRFLIVGAGPGGLTMARAFLRKRIEFDIVEKFSELGGIWNLANPDTPMYESCNFISSKTFGGFCGFPMPEHYADYPKNDLILDYVRSFADAYDLRQYIEFDTEMVEARPVEDRRGTWWQVTLSTGDVRQYRGVVNAAGHEWDPYTPEVEGIESFTGEVIHSKEYRSRSELVGKRVLVVGAGNSGVDIASDAGLVADRAVISTRRAYWFLPKSLFGIPIPDLFAGYEQFPDHPTFEGLDESQKFDLMLAMIGDMKKYGLPTPDHPLAATHPIVSNLALHCFSHGLLSWRPQIERIEGSTVHFDDGRAEEIDLIVFATGYDITVPWVPEGYLDYVGGRPVANLGTFVDGLEGFYFFGYIHVADNGWALFDRMAQMIVADAAAKVHGENVENVRELKESFRPDLRGGAPFVDTRRNTNQVDTASLHAAIDQVERRFGIALPDFEDYEFYGDIVQRPTPALLAAIERQKETLYAAA